MSDRAKSIDQIIEKQELRQDELQEIGAEIRSSSSKIVVAFIDLADSTQLKQDQEPDIWLGSVYRFLKKGDQLAKAASGTVVKRIGDELMVTFPDTAASENFIKAVMVDTVLAKFRFKITLDYGDAYHLNFGETKDDPYGEIVDRCARVAKFAGAGAILCTRPYKFAAGDAGDDYISGGSVYLKGIEDAQELFIRPIQAGNKDYLDILLRAINNAQSDWEEFKSIARSIDPAFIQNMQSGHAKPFLARHLLNLPRLAMPAEEYYEEAKRLKLAEVRRLYNGYYVEWLGIFDSYERDKQTITVKVNLPSSHSYFNYFEVVVPFTFIEPVKLLKKGDKLRVRGVILSYGMTAELNYADIEKIA